MRKLQIILKLLFMQLNLLYTAPSFAYDEMNVWMKMKFVYFTCELF